MIHKNKSNIVSLLYLSQSKSHAAPNFSLEGEAILHRGDTIQLEER
jgi:hypothetical protein